MPIEFRCSECGKLLRTDDNTVGRQAQCPECGAISTVPSLSTAPSESPFSPSAQLGGSNPFRAGPAPDAESSDNPYQSPVPPMYLAPGQTDSMAAQRVAGPATGLIVTAILGMVLQVLRIGANLVQMGVGHGIRQPREDVFPMMFGGGVDAGLGVLSLIVGAVVLVGAMKMKRLENHGFAMAAAIIAMLPCISPCCLLGLPFGIWALVVLGDGSVKAAFQS